jgi:hypothetical protein
MVETVWDLPLDARPDPDEFVHAAMDWHFNPETGSAYWLQKAKTLGFDPRTDVKNVTTPPLLEHIARHDDLVELINEKVQGICPRSTRRRWRR